MAEGLESLDPAWIPCERRAKLYESLVLVAGGAGVLALGPRLFGWDFGAMTPWLWSAYGVVIVLVWTHALLWPGLAWKHAAWRRSELGLEIRRGVLWRRVLDVPRSRVQHTDVLDGPLLRKYGLARLSVFTAGTTFAEVQLVGVRREVALELRDWLIGRSEEAVVD